MEFLKTLLGASFKDNMTADEISAALESAGVVTGGAMSKLKAQLDKASAEAADSKRKLKERMSEDEQKAAEAAQHLADLEAENATLKRNAAIAQHTADLIGQGYTAELATKVGTALADGDVKSVIAGMAEHGASQRTAIEQELLKNTPRPGAGAAGGTDYTKQIDEATARGDFTEVARLTRLSQSTTE